MRKILICIFAVFLVFEAKTQYAYSSFYTPNIYEDTSFVCDFGRSITVKSIAAFRHFTYSYTQNSGEYSFRFTPSSTYFAGLALSYRNIQVRLLLPVMHSKLEYEGIKSKPVNIHLGLRTNSLNGSISAQRYNYYSVKEKGVKAAELIEELPFFKVNLKGFYSFNSDYSMNAVYKQTQRQNRATGSLMAGFNTFFLINDMEQVYLGTVYGFETIGHLYNINLMLGYGYTYPFGNDLFVSSIAFLGGGLQFVRYNELSNAPDKVLSGMHDIRLSLGYNGDKWIFSMLAQTDGYRLQAVEHTLKMRGNYLKFNVARRFVL